MFVQTNDCLRGCYCKNREMIGVLCFEPNFNRKKTRQPYTEPTETTVSATQLNTLQHTKNITKILLRY